VERPAAHAVGQRRVVDQPVGPAEPRDLGGQRVDGAGVGDVGVGPVRLDPGRAQFRAGPLGPSGVAFGDQHPRPGLADRVRDGQAEPAPRAGDDDQPALQTARGAGHRTSSRSVTRTACGTTWLLAGLASDGRLRISNR
jgi:hypothetical protein